MQKSMQAKWINQRFMGAFAAYYVAQIIFFGFWPSILRGFGCTDTFIGLCSSVSTFAGMLLRLVMGYVFDKSGKPHAMVLGVFGFYCTMQTLVFLFGGEKWILILFSASAMSTVGLVGSFCESWLFKLQSVVGDIDYGRVRSCGSLSYAISGLFAGAVLEKWGNAASCGWVWLVMAVMVPLVVGLPTPPATLETDEAAAEEKEKLWPQAKRLFKNPTFLMLMIFASLDSITEMSVTGNYSVLVMEVGGNAQQSGIGFFVMAFTEFWVVFLFSVLAKKFTTRRLLLVGIFFTALRSFVMSYATTAWQMVALISLNALSFALTTPAKTLLLQEVLGYEFKTTGMQIYGIGSSILRMALAPIQGMVSDKYGVLMMVRYFTVFSVISLVAFSIYFTYLKKKESAEQTAA